MRAELQVKASILVAIYIFSLHDNESKMRLKYGVRVRSKRRVRYKKPSFEYNVTWAKGAVHVALSRPFVDYLLHNKVYFCKKFKTC